MNLAAFIAGNKDEITVLLSACALVVSALALSRPWIKEVLDRRKAIFQALQEDRKAIAIVTLRVLNGDWDKRLRKRNGFRLQLLQSLSIAVGLESSDRGKAYVLRALQHVARLDPTFATEAVEQLEDVLHTFEAYAQTGADPNFGKRIEALQAILQTVRQTRLLRPAAPV